MPSKEGMVPARGSGSAKSKAETVFFSADEMTRFFRALEREPSDTARDYSIVNLLTGVRDGQTC